MIWLKHVLDGSSMPSSVTPLPVVAPKPPTPANPEVDIKKISFTHIRPFVQKLLDCIDVGDYKEDPSGWRCLSGESRYEFAYGKDMEATITFKYKSVVTIGGRYPHLSIGYDNVDLTFDEQLAIHRKLTDIEDARTTQRTREKAAKLQHRISIIEAYTPSKPNFNLINEPDYYI